MVNATRKIKNTINGSKNIKINCSTVDKSLVSKGAREQDVYQQYLGALVGINIISVEFSDEIKYLRLITTALYLFCVDLILWMVKFLCTFC